MLLYGESTEGRRLQRQATSKLSICFCHTLTEQFKELCQCKYSSGFCCHWCSSYICYSLAGRCVGFGWILAGSSGTQSCCFVVSVGGLKYCTVLFQNVKAVTDLSFMTIITQVSECPHHANMHGKHWRLL